MSYPVPINSRFVTGLRRFSLSASAFVMFIGALVLAGWLFDIYLLKSLYGDITMKANAALSLLLAGASLCALNLNNDKAFARRAGQVCAALVALAGALTLSQHIFGWDLGIDQLLSTEPSGALATTSPGRMGPPASTCFTLYGIALLLLYTRRAVSLAQFLSTVVCLWALLAIIGYAYQAEQLYGVAHYTGIAFPTAAAFLLLGLGLIAARVDQGITSVIASGYVGGLMARRLLITAVGVPVLLGWFCLYAQRAGYYDLGFGTAALILSLIIIFTLVILQIAAKLNDIERQRLTAEAIVRENEEGARRQAALIELSYEPIFVWNLGGGIVEWNKGCEQLYGYAREEAITCVSHQLLNTEHPLSPDTYRQTLLRDGYWSGELRHTTRDGRQVVVESRQQLIESHGQRLVLETNRDITERKHAEEEREYLFAREQSMRAEAERANRLKDEFLATVSHEIRAPLNAILGWATMLHNGRIDKALAARAVETIERNARSQAQLIEDLLDVSRIISGKMRLEVKPTDLRLVINAAIDSVHPAAAAKEIQLQAVLDPAASHIQGDDARLQQVVWNLLSNAVKFTPKGGLVQVRLDRTDSKAQITVSDTGEGINSEFIPYVFDRFQQADGTTTRKHGGLGLGLAIVRHIVEMHGGTIEAHSAGVGKGASFTVGLPLVAVRATGSLSGDYAESASRGGASTAADSMTLHGLRILAVDDEPDARHMVKGVLEQYGADVVTAASAREAFEALPGLMPDVLVCDIGMPEEDGYSLIKRVRELKHEQGGNTPAIALTGYVRVEERIKALSAGYQMFVPKPVEAAELASIIASLVGRTDKGMGA